MQNLGIFILKAGDWRQQEQPYWPITDILMPLSNTIIFWGMLERQRFPLSWWEELGKEHITENEQKEYSNYLILLLHLFIQPFKDNMT